MHLAACQNQAWKICCTNVCRTSHNDQTCGGQSTFYCCCCQCSGFRSCFCWVLKCQSDWNMLVASPTTRQQERNCLQFCLFWSEVSNCNVSPRQLLVHVTKKATRDKLNWGAFWSNLMGPQGNQLLVSDHFPPPLAEPHTTRLLQKIQMTASFLHSHQDCRKSTTSVPEELSGMQHSATPGFRPVTETICLANSCLKDGNHHHSSSQMLGKNVHLSQCWLNMQGINWLLASDKFAGLLDANISMWAPVPFVEC